MTAEMSTGIRASRYWVPRTRGATSGALLLVLGAWAAVVPFIGPYFDFAYTPQPNNTWHWTSARGWLEVAPGAAAFLGGLLLLMSASRVVTMLGGWLAAAGGAWLIIAPPLSTTISGINLGTPDPTSSARTQALEALFFFYAIGAAILFVSSVALGRLSTRTLRDVQAAERKVAEEQADESPMFAAEPAEAPAMAAAGRHTGAGAPGQPTTGYPTPPPGTYAEPTYSPPPPPREDSDNPPTTP